MSEENDANSGLIEVCPTEEEKPVQEESNENNEEQITEGKIEQENISSQNEEEKTDIKQEEAPKPQEEQGRTEITQKEENNSNQFKSKIQDFLLKYKLQVGIAAVILLLLIYFIFIYTPPFHRFMGLLPFIYDEKVANTLREYLKTQPSRHAFLVTGPHGSGKTKLISLISKEYLEAGNLSINLDFSLAKSPEEVIGFGKLSLIKSLEDFIKEETRKKQANTKQNKNAQKNQQTTVLNQKQNELPQVFRNLILALNNSLINAKGVSDFFSILESIHETYHPAVFVYGSNNAAQFTPEMYTALFSRLSQKDQYKDHIPIILETTNTLLKNEDLPFFIRIVELEGVKDPYDAFVSDTKCFTKAEMKKIMQNVGNNGGEIEAIFESVKVGHDINAAIDMRYQVANQSISSLYTKGYSLIHRELCGDDKSFYRSIQKTDSMYQLAMHGYIYVDKTNSLTSSTKLINKLLC